MSDLDNRVLAQVGSHIKDQQAINEALVKRCERLENMVTVMQQQITHLQAMSANNFSTGPTVN